MFGELKKCRQNVREVSIKFSILWILIFNLDMLKKCRCLNWLSDMTFFFIEVSLLFSYLMNHLKGVVKVPKLPNFLSLSMNTSKRFLFTSRNISRALFEHEPLYTGTRRHLKSYLVTKSARVPQGYFSFLEPPALT